MPRRLLLLVASTVMLLGGCATPAPVSEGNPRGSYQHTEKYLSWLVDREMAENEITGLSIALVDDQQVIRQNNVTDLSQFLKMQFAGGKSGPQQILSGALIAEMLRVQNADLLLTFNAYVGLGWMLSGIEVPGGGPVASHGGSQPDSHSMMAMLPEHKLGVVVLSNSVTAHFAVSKIAGEPLRLIHEDNEERLGFSGYRLRKKLN